MFLSNDLAGQGKYTIELGISYLGGRNGQSSSVAFYTSDMVMPKCSGSGG